LSLALKMHGCTRALLGNRSDAFFFFLFVLRLALALAVPVSAVAVAEAGVAVTAIPAPALAQRLAGSDKAVRMHKMPL
jgi:hypothetical protein